DRGVVQVAEAGRAVGTRVMAGGAAERVDDALAGEQRIGRGGRRLAGAQAREPGLGAHRYRQISEIPADPPDDAFARTGLARLLLRASAPVGEGVRPHFGTVVGQDLPASPDALE